MQTVTQDDAIARLPQLIDAALQQGEEVVVLRNQIAVAKIVPLPQELEDGESLSPREPGSARGLIHMHDNFDDPIEDFADYS